jgi:hypothetical protein
MRLLALVLALSLQASEKSPVLVVRGAKVYTGARGSPRQRPDHHRSGQDRRRGKDVPVPADARIVGSGGQDRHPRLIDPASGSSSPGEKSPGSAEQNVLDALDVYQRDYLEASSRASPPPTSDPRAPAS